MWLTPEARPRAASPRSRRAGRRPRTTWPARIARRITPKAWTRPSCPEPVQWAGPPGRKARPLHGFRRWAVLGSNQW